MLIDEFVILSNKVTTSRDLVVLWRDAMKKIGFDRLLFMLLMDHRTIRRKVGIVAVDNYPAAWLKQYYAQRFEEVDPVNRHMFITRDAFTWDSLRNSGKLLPVQIAMLDRAKLAGLNSGIGIPLRGPFGELAGVMAASSVARPPWKTVVLDYADLLTQQFYTVFLRLERKEEAEGDVRLTDRERQVLALCANGSSQKEMANAMKVTIHTVKFHMKSVLLKLEVANQEGAVMKAVAMGLLSRKHTPDKEE